MMRAGTDEHKVLALTKAAALASEEGRWDDVLSFYAQRESVASLAQLSPNTARQIIEYDRALRSRIRIVQKAIQQDCDRLAAQRRDLLRLKQSWFQSSLPYPRFIHIV